MESSEDKVAESHIILLLQLIYAGADVDALLERGLEFSQIAEMISSLIEEEFIEETNSELKVTKLGLERITKGIKKLNIKGGWISPLDQYRIEKLDKEDVYLPWFNTYHEIAESLALREKSRE